ncbi:Orexin receptor type 2 [Branchiostoma belcheri]|nr:Orexin receptor type 2 [Branchiostoma belcheri]
MDGQLHFKPVSLLVPPQVPLLVPPQVSLLVPPQVSLTTSVTAGTTTSATAGTTTSVTDGTTTSVTAGTTTSVTAGTTTSVTAGTTTSATAGTTTSVTAGTTTSVTAGTTTSVTAGTTTSATAGTTTSVTAGTTISAYQCLNLRSSTSVRNATTGYNYCRGHTALPESVTTARQPLMAPLTKPSQPLTHGHELLLFNEPENREERRTSCRKKEEGFRYICSLCSQQNVLKLDIHKSKAKDTHCVKSFNNAMLVYHDKRISFGRTNYLLRVNLAILDCADRGIVKPTQTYSKSEEAGTCRGLTGYVNKDGYGCYTFRDPNSGARIHANSSRTGHHYTATCTSATVAILSYEYAWISYEPSSENEITNADVDFPTKGKRSPKGHQQKWREIKDNLTMESGFLAHKAAPHLAIISSDATEKHRQMYNWTSRVAVPLRESPDGLSQLPQGDRRNLTVRDVLPSPTEQQDIKDKDLKEKLRCKICLERGLKVAFQCGHMFCHICATAMATCPACEDDRLKKRSSTCTTGGWTARPRVSVGDRGRVDDAILNLRVPVAFQNALRFSYFYDVIMTVSGYRVYMCEPSTYSGQIDNADPSAQLTAAPSTKTTPNPSAQEDPESEAERRSWEEFLEDMAVLDSLDRIMDDPGKSEEQKLAGSTRTIQGQLEAIQCLKDTQDVSMINKQASAPGGADAPAPGGADAPAPGMTQFTTAEGSEDITLKFKQIKVVDPNVAEHIAESARLNAGIRVRAGTKIRLELNWYHASGVDFWVSVYMKKKKGNILAKNQRRPSECERRAGASPQKLGRRVAGMQNPIGQQLQVRQAPDAEKKECSHL